MKTYTIIDLISATVVAKNIHADDDNFHIIDTGDTLDCQYDHDAVAEFLDTDEFDLQVQYYTGED